MNEVDNVNDPFWDLLTEWFDIAGEKCARFGSGAKDKFDSFRRKYGG